MRNRIALSVQKRKVSSRFTSGSDSKESRSKGFLFLTERQSPISWHVVRTPRAEGLRRLLSGISTLQSAALDSSWRRLALSGHGM